MNLFSNKVKCDSSAKEMYKGLEDLSKQKDNIEIVPFSIAY